MTTSFIDASLLNYEFTCSFPTNFVQTHLGVFLAFARSLRKNEKFSRTTSAVVFRPLFVHSVQKLVASRKFQEFEQPSDVSHLSFFYGPRD